MSWEPVARPRDQQTWWSGPTGTWLVPASDSPVPWGPLSTLTTTLKTPRELLWIAVLLPRSLCYQ